MWKQSPLCTTTAKEEDITKNPLKPPMPPGISFLLDFRLFIGGSLYVGGNEPPETVFTYVNQLLLLVAVGTGCLRSNSPTSPTSPTT